MTGYPLICFRKVPFYGHEIFYLRVYLLSELLVKCHWNWLKYASELRKVFACIPFSEWPFETNVKVWNI